MTFGISISPSTIGVGLSIQEKNIDLDLNGTPAPSGGSVPDEPYSIIDLSEKILGNIPASQPGGFITGDGVQCKMAYTRVGRTVSGNVTFVVPGTASWPEADPFFPINVIALKASDLPFMPKGYEAIGGIAPPQVGGFGLFNVNWFDGETPNGEGFSVGSVITDFGGSLANGGVMSFFHAGNNTETQLANLVYDGNKVGLINRDIVVYNRFEYEAAYAIGEEPEES